jgi:hypothetical protein
MKREADEAMDERLASIGRRTAALRPRGGFDDRVMQAVKSSRSPGLFDDVLRAARAMVPVAVMAAALAMGWAVRADRAADTALAASFDAVELEW